MLDVVCAKYGWTLHYALWEISYLNLSMMLTDSISTVDIKDDEKHSSSINSNTMSNRGGGLQGFINKMRGL